MSHFFALLARMRHIRRWGLMVNAYPENLAEHSLQTAVFAHALAVLRREVFGGQADPDAVAAAALFHDAPEILTGDLPTPVKYFTPELRGAYAQAERCAADTLLSLLPEDLRAVYAPLFAPADQPPEVQELVHAADKLAALAKCREELSAGNQEFADAAEHQRNALREMNLPEADYFLEHFMPSFGLTLDKLR